MLTGEDEVLIDLIRYQPEVVLPGQLDEARTVSSGKTAPVGFDGLLMMSALVRGVIRSSISPISGKYPFSGRSG